MSEPRKEQIKLAICIPRMKDHHLVDEYLRQASSEMENIVPVVLNEIKDVEVETYTNAGTLVLLSMVSKDDLFGAIQLLTSLENDVREGTVRVIVLDQLQNEKLNDFLKSKGVSESIRAKVSFKTFKYKVDKHAKFLGKIVSRIRGAKLSETPIEDLISGFETTAAKIRKQMSRMVELSPIEHDSDFWLFTRPNSLRFVNQKWFVSLHGPGPGFGSWDAGPKSRHGQEGWVFNPRDSQDRRFYQDGGRWVFFGNKPEYSWEERKWLLISKKPELLYFQGEVLIHGKISLLEGGGIRFCGNSKTAMAKKEEIDSTIESDIRVKGLKINDENSFIKRDEDSKNIHVTNEAEESHKNYQGRFGKDFEERKIRYHQYYDCSELKLSLVAKNGSLVMERIWIDLVELRPHYVVLDAPAGVIEVDDQIELEAFYIERGVSKKVMINAATQVVETENENPGQGTPAKLRSLVICELSSELEPQFIELIKAFKLRREELNDFFTKAKGVA